MTEPREPTCSDGMVPHRDRVKNIEALLREGQVGGICIDDTQEHRDWYLHELNKYPRLSVEFQGVLSPGIYMIKVRKGPSHN